MPAASCRPPLADPRLDFVAEGLRFAEEHRGDAAFRFLRAFTRCTEDELTAIMGKIHCDSLPECCGEYESLPRSIGRSLALPFYYLAAKKLFWRQEPAVLFDLETIDAAYFRKWYATIFDALPSPKRVTPSLRPLSLPGVETAEPIPSSVAPRSAALLLLAPLFIPALASLSLRRGRNILASYRRALSIYAVFDGHFRRYPCRDFISYDDVLNHPCRRLAFRQNCAGELVVVQNGERSYHPLYAFGAIDHYLTFGPYTERLYRELRTFVGRATAVGALNLNERRGLLDELERAPAQTAYDILLIDQGWWPYNGFDEKTGRSFETLFANLARLKKENPGYRIAYQLRPYGAGAAAHKKLVLDAVSRLMGGAVEVLENTGSGESYRNIYRSRLTMTMSSTIGHEAFFFGADKKVLFVNFAGNPYEIYSDDARFQLYDEAGDYGRFRDRVRALLDLRLAEPPAVAVERHSAFDGRVQERIAAALKAEAHV